jgi:chromatin remodeling complex protein RSC6
MPATASHSNANTMPAADNKTVKKAAAKKTEAAPAAQAAPAAAPAPEAKAPRAKKAAAPAPAAKAEVTVPVVQQQAPAAEGAPAQPASFNAVAERLREVQTRLTGELKEIVREALAAAKSAAREVKDARKKRRVRKDPSEMTAEEKAAWEARRANNAFLKPRALSPELCAFLGIPAGSQRSQTEVTKFVSQYVKSHSCFDPANKRRIIPDGALSKLLKVTDKDSVTYLNLQTHLKAHFVKA